MIIQDALQLGAFRLREELNRNLVFAFVVTVILSLLFLLPFACQSTLEDSGIRPFERAYNESVTVQLENHHSNDRTPTATSSLSSVLRTIELPASNVKPVATARMGDIVATMDANVPDISDLTTMPGAISSGTGTGSGPSGDAFRIGNDLGYAEGVSQGGSPDSKDMYPEFVAESVSPTYNRQELAANIHYPTIAEQNEIEGEVYVEVRINEDGSIAGTRIAKSTNHIFDSAALEAVGSTQFSPAMQNGYGVKMRITIPIRFRLHQ